MAGAVLLGAALFPVRRMMQELPDGNVRLWWKILSVLIFFFFAGYIAFTIVHWNFYSKIADLIVPAIFFFGAVFVLMVSTLSLQTAINVKRICRLEHENITDPLMSIFNRRYMDRRLKEEIIKAHRYHFPLSILLIDIDHFKKVNDVYGHQMGDIVLQNLGKLIGNAVRQSDTVARYGGEEILVILPHTVDLCAADLAERLRHLVETTEMVPVDVDEARPAIHITCSIGVACLNKQTSSGREFLGYADKALYQAKNSGRNRVFISDTGPDGYNNTVSFQANRCDKKAP